MGFRSFGDGHRSGPVAQMGEAFLEVERMRVVDGAADAAGFQIGLQPVAAGVPDRVQVIDALHLGRFGRQEERRVGEQGAVPVGNPAAALVPFGQVREFRAQHGALDSLHAVIVPDLVMQIAGGRPMLPQ